jgi:hypothetical protein
MEEVAKLIRAEAPHIYIRNIMIGTNFVFREIIDKLACRITHIIQINLPTE